MRFTYRTIIATICGAVLALSALAQERPRDQPLKVRGKIVKVDAQDQFVIRTDDNKDVTLYVSPQSRFMLDGKAARFTDLKVGTVIDAAYVVQGDRYIVGDVTVGPAPLQEGTLLEGTIVKVVGNDQVIIRAADGKETTIYVTPQTKYTLTQQGGAFVDLQPNMPIRTYYEVRDRRPIARAILRGTPVRPRP